MGRVETKTTVTSLIPAGHCYVLVAMRRRVLLLVLLVSNAKPPVATNTVFSGAVSLTADATARVGRRLGGDAIGAASSASCTHRGR